MTGFDLLLKKLSSYGISGRVFLSNRGLRSLPKNIQVMLVFLKALFLALHFSVYTSMAYLMMLSVKLQSMLMILLSTISVIRNVICGKTYETL